jgi:hypothetical protein
MKLWSAISIVFVWGLAVLWGQNQAPLLQYGVLPFNTTNTATDTGTLAIGQVATSILVGTPTNTATYTTPTATAFCNAFPFVKTNQQKRWTYSWYVKNTTVTPAFGITVAGGSGVTVSGSGLVGGGGIKRFQVILDDCGTPAVHLLPVGSAGW